ncbi:tropomyosin alpha-4 chain-like [Phoenix dactylifera]|uniref:Tropomyosin alpha-4 chain-like n=1 Tax=Phoenix dactylifera TaxID=42345 RepID=A0A8B7C3V1_PHODC|nr:tropomyosin alpha-4 chain-like [Phoenix dactylifera]
MEGKDDGVVSNGSVALEKDEALIGTLDQDQEGGEKEKKAETDADGTIYLIGDEFQGLQAEKQELERQLDDARKELHRAEGENRSLAGQAHHLEGELVRTQEDLAAAASAAEDFEAEADHLKRAIKDLEADKASLIADKAALEAKISALEGRLLAAAEEKEGKVRALQAKAEELEMKVRDLTEGLRHSKEQAKEAVEEQAKIGAAREEELQQVIKALEETKTRLEGEHAEFCSNIDRNLGERDAAVAAMEKGLNVAWVAAAVASVGAVAAGAVAVYLRKVGQR